MPREIVRKPLTRPTSANSMKDCTWSTQTVGLRHIFACAGRIFEQALTAGCIPPLRVDGDVRPTLPHAMRVIAYSFDRSAIDITEPLTRTSLVHTKQEGSRKDLAVGRWHHGHVQHSVESCPPVIMSARCRGRHVRPPVGSRRFIIGVGRVCSCRRDAWNCPLIFAHVTVSRLWLLQYAVEGSIRPLDRLHGMHEWLG